jgi:general secretion pathway protein L
MGGEPAAPAAAPAAAPSDDRGPAVLLEAGPERASLVLLDGATVQLVRSLATTGRPAWDAATTDPAALVRLVAPLVRDLKITLRTQSAAGRAQPGRLWLAGPLASLPGAAELLAAELDLQASPLQTTAGLLPAGSAPAPAMAMALGLSLRAQQPRGRLNFRRGEFAFTKDLSQARGQLVRLGLAAAVVLALSLGLGVSRIATLGRQAADYDEALCAATKRVLGNCLSDYKVAVSQMSGGGSKAAGLPRVSATEVLAELTAHLPEGTVPQLEEVDISTTTVHLRGVAEGFKQVDQIKDALKADKCFGEIKPPRSEKLQGSSKVSFVIDFPYICSGEAGGA